jgi:HlyD family secretion protein
MRAKRIVPVLVLVVAALAVWQWARHGNGDPNTIRLSGNIELTEVNLSFKSAGRIGELTVREGDLVEKGQVLARLDSRETEHALARERAAAQAAASALEQLRTGIAYQRAALEQETALRQAELAQAEARLQELERGARPQEKEQAKAAAAEAEVQRQLARADWERAQTLYKNEDISTAQFDQFRTRFQSAEAAARRAAEALALVEEGPRVEQIEQARAAVARARAAYKLTQAGQLDLRRREQEVDARTADLQRAQAQAAVLETQLADRTLYAPVSGVVMTRSAEPGEVVAAGAVVLTLGDIERPWARAYLPERDLGRVKLGMPAELVSDSFPDKRYSGRVSFISAEAEFTPKQIQTQEERVKLVYRIKVDTPNPAHELKSNMPVDVMLRVGS